MSDQQPSHDSDSLLRQLTLREKASLTSGSDFWHTQPVESLGLGRIMMADGPTGLRKQADVAGEAGPARTVPATCFPTATTLGSSWDPDLVERVGAAIAREAKDAGVSVVLAPGVNIKRSPLCGRNFEYLSEDPHLSGELGLAFVRGLQSEGIGASVKHFAVNNAETDRMRVSAEVDERTLHEIYLAAFERVVTAGEPWTVMASYNRINGTYATESAWLLRDVLREAWGFDGVVVSDWGAVHDRVAALRAGTDLTMPPFDDDEDLVDAIRDGALDEALLDEAVRRVLGLVTRAHHVEHPEPPADEAAPPDADADADADDGDPAAAADSPAVLALVDDAAEDGDDDDVDAEPHTPEHPPSETTEDDAESAPPPRSATAETVLDEHHALAREAAAAGAVLLKNDLVGGAPLLPIDDPTSLLIVGELARTPRYQGSGSSRVTPTRIESPLEALRATAEVVLAFEPGYTLDGPAEEDRTLRAAAVAAARDARTVVCFLGLPDAYESEGYDRTHLELPPSQVELVLELVSANPHLVVVLSNGGVVAPAAWARQVPALLDVWLAGQAVGSAVADLLVGRTEPAGRLAETIPFRLEDTPAYLDFPGHLGHSRYGEGVFVGYRYYDAKRIPPAYPFGFGLGYTTFAHGDLAVDVSGSGDDVSATVAVTVTNTGQRRGSEVVQVYVHDADAPVARPEQELKGFAKVTLDPGTSRRVEIPLGPRAFAYWHPMLRRWVVEPGHFSVRIGASSLDIRRSAAVTIGGDEIRTPLTAESTLQEWLADPDGGPLLSRTIEDLGESASFAAEPMASQMPLSVLAGLGGLPRDAVDGLVAEVNRPGV